jgi:hypothetical protein
VSIPSQLVGDKFVARFARVNDRLAGELRPLREFIKDSVNRPLAFGA